jgi:PAS domain S-box-containing protein
MRIWALGRGGFAPTLCAVCASAHAMAGSEADSSGSLGLFLLASLLALLAIALVVRRMALRRQVSRLAAGFRPAGLPIGHTSSVEGRSPLQSMALSLSSYRESLEYAQNARSEESAQRLAVQASLRTVEERYRLAVRCADDAVWEWDLRADRVYFSERWKNFLGYADHEISDRIDEWCQRIHPEDSERVLGELRDHLEGRAARLESEHRLQHRDGSWRWAHARATAVRDVHSEPSRLVGLVSDISARKHVEHTLVAIADGLSGSSGEQCLRTLVRSFAAVLEVHEAFVCECSDFPATRVRMLARWKGEDFARCVDFDLAGTACEEVIGAGETVFLPRGAGERWPLERTFERDSYLGIPCHDSQGQVIGHIACADPGAMSPELPHQAILKIFALRASIELERRLLEQERLTLGLHSSPASTSTH